MVVYLFFFFNDTATTEIYTLSLHDALPIYGLPEALARARALGPAYDTTWVAGATGAYIYVALAERLPPRRVQRALRVRSEEHTSELQSRQYLVCRLLLEKKKNK